MAGLWRWELLLQKCFCKQFNISWDPTKIFSLIDLVYGSKLFLIHLPTRRKETFVGSFEYWNTFSCHLLMIQFQWLKIYFLLIAKLKDKTKSAWNPNALFITHSWFYYFKDKKSLASFITVQLHRAVHRGCVLLFNYKMVLQQIHLQYNTVHATK